LRPPPATPSFRSRTYRSALQLRYLQHLKVDDVAEVLQLSVGTVKSQLARGLRLLTDRLGGAMEGEEA